MRKKANKAQYLLSEDAETPSEVLSLSSSSRAETLTCLTDMAADDSKPHASSPGVACSVSCVERKMIEACARAHKSVPLSSGV